VRLDRLLGGVDVLEIVGDPSRVDVRAITHDSRLVRPGALFCCVPGGALDGHDFAAGAVAGGAAALLCEHRLPVDAVQVRVGAVRPAMALVAAALFGHPSERLSVVGVTGTNGKTTVTHMLKAVLDAAGVGADVLGTLSGSRTTPESTDLQRILAELEGRGVRAVAMEVSSHALAQHRVDAVSFSAAVFTNLSHEHLDFHGNMEAYFAAKSELFRPERAARAVINASDPWGRRLAESIAAAGAPPLQLFSDSDVEDICVGLRAVDFSWRGRAVHVPLGGRVNVSNALAAATTAASLGVEEAAVVAGLAATPPVPGRMEVVDAGQPFTVIVDYAHTPDGLERVLDAARPPGAPHRVAVVFGCGGQRDRGKRPLMGEVAAGRADLAVLTNDNPRDEDPAAIIEEVRAGVRNRERLVVEPDREAAIALALDWAGPGDVVVVAGKGHETGQQIGASVRPFDDREVARRLLERGPGRSAGCGAGR
jgi:UDP-N-acetylmuramoyl-L-alanyl-D-glutamate--2,6-diaminopimelate ligase